MTFSPPPDHITFLPCLLLRMNCLLHHPLIISASGQDMLPLLPPHLILSATYHAYAPTEPSRYDSNAATLPYASSPLPYLLRSLPLSCSPHALMICLQRCNPMSTLTHPYTSAPPLLTMLMLWWLVGVQCNHRNMLSGLLCKQVLGEIGGDIHNVVVRV
ncbi:hypothetical protein O181_065178 [Austropuccinia psidii MF-1]|uniref:Uncharacterized protein n=1 Tax=Austropuccinia psidii MF-1 TaxID=1389203 RepID=A0A9Q3EUW8_9BASI|nr:hypothetical protein [Austropuccinia psidii MF-1]